MFCLLKQYRSWEALNLGVGAAISLAIGHDIMNAFVLQSSVWHSGIGTLGWRLANAGPATTCLHVKDAFPSFSTN